MDTNWSHIRNKIRDRIWNQVARDTTDPYRHEDRVEIRNILFDTIWVPIKQQIWIPTINQRRELFGED